MQSTYTGCLRLTATNVIQNHEVKLHHSQLYELSASLALESLNQARRKIAKSATLKVSDFQVDGLRTSLKYRGIIPE